MLPDTPQPTRHTVRERIMQNMKTLFETNPAEYIQWGVVTRRPINGQVIGTHPYGLGLYDVSEKEQPGAGYVLNDLNVVIEFHVQLMENDEPSTFLNHCIGDIVRRLADDRTLGELAVNVEKKGSELDIDGAIDQYVSGIVVLSVSYRCKINDPYTRV